MLTAISISNLFDLYSYNLDLKTKDSKVCFITGPNGYGKTSILNIIAYIYNREWEKLCNVPFERVSLVFSDGSLLTILQSRESFQEEESDEFVYGNLTLNVEFQLTSEDTYSFIWTKDSACQSIPDKNIELFFSSHPVYYIRDGRLYSPNHIPTINRCVDSMREFLRDSYKAASHDFKEKLDVFSQIIHFSDFADKLLQIEPRYGFRFILNNDVKTILAPERLSSGEQHLTVMAFELLFMAPDDSLVLIDEPEISFHMLWQVDFLSKLNLILNTRKLQCIVATHSPQIFNMKWNLSVDLYSQANQNSQGHA